MYRLLKCNFSLAPKEELDEDQLDELGIPEVHQLTFTNLMNIIKEIVPPVIEFIQETPICLPPSLNALAGFRGILLHRRYLESSASRPYVPPQPAVAPLPANEETAQEPEPIAGPSNGAEPIESVVGNGLNRKNRLSHSYESSRMEYDEPLPSTSGVDAVNQQVSDSLTLSESTEAAQNPENVLQNEENNAEEEEEEHQPVFGDENADMLLLSRMISVFFWPGIMSTMK